MELHVSNELCSYKQTKIDVRMHLIVVDMNWIEIQTGSTFNLVSMA